MDRCQTQFDILKESVETYIWTFRWLWLLNLGGVIYGIYVKHYDLAVFAAVAALIAMIGVARARRGMKQVERVRNTCLPPQERTEM